MCLNLLGLLKVLSRGRRKVRERYVYMCTLSSLRGYPKASPREYSRRICKRARALLICVILVVGNGDSFNTNLRLCETRVIFELGFADVVEIWAA
jgi:hypothetical protein